MSEEATLDEFVNEESDCDASENEMRTSLDQTSVGNIPDDWSAVRLGKLTENTLYGANESAEDYDPDKPRYIRIKDIDSRGRLKNTDKASLSPEKAEGYLLNEGDMLFARSGSPGRTYLHRHESGKYCYGGYSIKHELVSENLNHEYISQYTKSQKYWDWIERIARTGAQANINSREYSSLLVPLPPLPEQRKIATVLYTVDQAIEKTAETIEQLSRIKQGIRQDLLTSGLRQEGEARPSPESEPDQYINARQWSVPKSWELKELSDICSIQVGYAFKSDWYQDEGDVRVLRGANVGYGEPDWSETKYLDPNRVPEYDEYQLEAGDLIIGMDRPYTKSGFKISRLSETDVPSLLVQRVGRFIPEDCDPDYLHVVLSDWRYQKQVLRRAQGMDIPHISQTDILSPKIPLPPIGEQKRIAENYLSILNKIGCEEDLLSRYKRMKQGLMQDLLSGTVRTTDTNITVPDEVAQHG